jgi:SAM-dependent methyltransferase
MENFKLYSKYYDLLYRDKDYKVESEYVYAILKRYASFEIKSMIELGCGSGGHAKFLASKKLRITGLDQSAEMIHLANSKNINNFEGLVSDISNFEFPKKFDCAISLFHVMSYLTQQELFLKTLKCVNKHLNPDGIFFFDCWFTPAVINLKPSIKVKSISDNEYSVTRIAEPQIDYLTSTVNIDFKIFIEDLTNSKISKLNELHKMRHFSILELNLFAKLSGFVILNIEEFLTSTVPSENTWAISVVLKKIKEL